MVSLPVVLLCRQEVGAEWAAPTSIPVASVEVGGGRWASLFCRGLRRTEAFLCTSTGH